MTFFSCFGCLSRERFSRLICTKLMSYYGYPIDNVVSDCKEVDYTNVALKCPLEHLLLYKACHTLKPNMFSSF